MSFPQTQLRALRAEYSCAVEGWKREGKSLVQRESGRRRVGPYSQGFPGQELRRRAPGLPSGGLQSPGKTDT